MSKRHDFVSLDEPRHSYFNAIYQAFYSKSLYLDVVKRWQGFGFIYLLFLVGVSGIPLTYYTTSSTLRYFNEQVLEPLSRIPEISITQHKVEFDYPMPYFITNKKTHQASIIIDTTGTVNSLNGEKYKQVLLLVTRDKVFFRPGRGKVQEYAIEQLHLKGTFSGKQLLASENFMSNWRFIIKMFTYSAYPIVVSLLFGVLAVLLLFFAFIAQIMSKTVFKYDINYKQTVRLSFVAVTPYLFLSTLNVITGWYNVFMGACFFLVLLGYFIFGLLINRRHAKQLVHV